jgi:hypothetical protein
VLVDLEAAVVRRDKAARRLEFADYELSRREIDELLEELVSFPPEQRGSA